jgi:hypothetical protein
MTELDVDLGEIKKKLQEHFTDGLVTIVGSGLSVACGLPSMQELAEELQKQIPLSKDEHIRKSWEQIKQELAKKVVLEEALRNVAVDNPVIPLIIKITGDFIVSRERAVLSWVYAGEIKLPFCSVLPHLIFSSNRVYVITTNYDRLIEIAAEMCGLGIDTLFPGQYYGQYNPTLSREALWTGRQTSKGNGIKRHFKKHVVVCKPQGSLDWFQHNGEPVRCTLPIDGDRLMITPGQNKYRMGYEKPFDSHRDEANRAIDNAARFLVIGYGFNDDQLETHLKPELRKGKPCIILTKELSSNGQNLVRECGAIMSISSTKDGKGTLIATNSDTLEVPNKQLWDLENFVKEVLE